MLGPAEEMFDALAESDINELYLHNKNPIDAWFLDGFSPSKNQNIWNISKKNKINIDPSIDLEWISLIVPTSGSPSFNFEYSIFFKDGNFEDFLFYPPFPNPSYSQDCLLYTSPSPRDS